MMRCVASAQTGLRRCMKEATVGEVCAQHHTHGYEPHDVPWRGQTCGAQTDQGRGRRLRGSQCKHAAVAAVVCDGRNINLCQRHYRDGFVPFAFADGVGVDVVASDRHRARMRRVLGLEE